MSIHVWGMYTLSIIIATTIIPSAYFIIINFILCYACIDSYMYTKVQVPTATAAQELLTQYPITPPIYGN